MRKGYILINFCMLAGNAQETLGHDQRNYKCLLEKVNVIDIHRESHKPSPYYCSRTPLVV